MNFLKVNTFVDPVFGFLLGFLSHCFEEGRGYFHQPKCNLHHTQKTHTGTKSKSSICEKFTYSFKLVLFSSSNRLFTKGRTFVSKSQSLVLYSLHVLVTFQTDFDNSNVIFHNFSTFLLYLGLSTV